MLSVFPRDVLDEIWDYIGSVSESFPTYSYFLRLESTEKTLGMSPDLLMHTAYVLKCKLKRNKPERFNSMTGHYQKCASYFFR